MEVDNSNLVLAIEAAIAGGSLSLCRGEVEIASWSGPADVSKAEDLLFNIDVLLRENGVSKRDLGLLVVSAGPGSFTGIRIGIATALGLKTGLGIPMATVSSLAAMVAYPDLNGPVYAAVPSGRQAVCFQKFSVEDGAVTELTEPQTIREADFLAHGFDEPKTPAWPRRRCLSARVSDAYKEDRKIEHRRSDPHCRRGKPEPLVGR
jgi:tRNA threonylcarbamoyl adenosine modification protein YeaZ